MNNMTTRPPDHQTTEAQQAAQDSIHDLVKDSVETIGHLRYGDRQQKHNRQHRTVFMILLRTRSRQSGISGMGIYPSRNGINCIERFKGICGILTPYEGTADDRLMGSGHSSSLPPHKETNIMTTTPPDPTQTTEERLAAHNPTRYINTQKLICMRCGAWDDASNRPDERRCGLNCALLTPGKICGFNCKLQRYQANLRARGLL
jgi:ribosomal protein L40E